jgi:hypothetical protein
LGWKTTALSGSSLAMVCSASPLFGLQSFAVRRDLERAQNQPWFAEYLHPMLAEYFRPNPANHGSYFLGWTSTDEVFWKENYRLWMAALREFDRRGGLIGMGDDAGFIYQTVRLRPDSQHGTPPGGGLPSHQDHPAGHRQ